MEYGMRSRLMKMKIISGCGVLLIISFALFSCTATITQTQTQTQTLPPTIYTQTVGAADVSDYLTEAKKVYTDDGIVHGDLALNPILKVISESDFLSLTVHSENTISMGGKLFNYVAINPFTTTSRALPAKVKLGANTIDLSIPDIVTTGGEPISIHINNAGNSVPPVSTDFTYYYIPIQITTYSVSVEIHAEGDLRFIFMYYYPASSSARQQALWLVLSSYQTP